MNKDEFDFFKKQNELLNERIVSDPRVTSKYKKDLLLLLEKSVSKEDYYRREELYVFKNVLTNNASASYWVASWSMIPHILEKFNKEY